MCFPPLTSQTRLPATYRPPHSCAAVLSAPTEPLTSSALYVECLHCSSLKKPIQLSAELLSLKGLVSWVQSQCLATWVAACGNPTQHTTRHKHIAAPATLACPQSSQCLFPSFPNSFLVTVSQFPLRKLPSSSPSSFVSESLIPSLDSSRGAVI